MKTFVFDFKRGVAYFVNEGVVSKPRIRRRLFVYIETPWTHTCFREWSEEQMRKRIQELENEGVEVVLRRRPI